MGRRRAVDFDGQNEPGARSVWCGFWAWWVLCSVLEGGAYLPLLSVDEEWTELGQTGSDSEARNGTAERSQPRKSLVKLAWRTA